MACIPNADASGKKRQADAPTNLYLVTTMLERRLLYSPPENAYNIIGLFMCVAGTYTYGLYVYNDVAEKFSE